MRQCLRRWDHAFGISDHGLVDETMLRWDHAFSDDESAWRTMQRIFCDTLLFGDPAKPGDFLQKSGFCLAVELHRRGSATPSSLNFNSHYVSSGILKLLSSSPVGGSWQTGLKVCHLKEGIRSMLYLEKQELFMELMSVDKYMVVNCIFTVCLISTKQYQEQNQELKHFQWYSILSDIPFWVSFFFKKHYIFCDI